MIRIATLPRLCRLLPTALLFVSYIALAVGPTASVCNAAEPAAAPFAGPAVADAALARIAGREDETQAAVTVQTSTVSRNVVGDNSVTGAITFTPDAFASFSGLAVVNANTGNNVSFNANMSVIIAIR